MKYLPFLICGLLYSILPAQTLLLQNPSFIGEPGEENLPIGWWACHPLSTADVQPGAWTVDYAPYEGDTYLSLVSRGNEEQPGREAYYGTVEDVYTPLAIPLQPSFTYEFSVALAFFNKGPSNSIESRDSWYGSPIRLEVIGVGEDCALKEVLWTSPVIDHQNWRLYEAVLVPQLGPHTHLMLRAAFAESGAVYFGNIMVDAVQLEWISPPPKMPNLFSPNGDGINELFGPFDTEAVQKVDLTIFDRWGRRLYQQQDLPPGTGWDGRTFQRLAPEGIYYYVLRYQHTRGRPETLKGSFTLVR